jgi:hypothetical protein
VRQLHTIGPEVYNRNAPTAAGFVLAGRAWREADAAWHG